MLEHQALGVDIVSHTLVLAELVLDQAAGPAAAFGGRGCFWRKLLFVRVMFVDESGCLGALPMGKSKIQPVFCMAGVILPVERVAFLTREWIELKRRYFPGLCRRNARPWDWQRAEVKGAEVRANLRSTRRKEQRQAIGFTDRVLDLMQSHRARFVARTWIKVPGDSFDPNSVYTFSMQALCADFQEMLFIEDAQGLVIADSRMPRPNSRVSHSIFTMRYRAKGDAYPNLVEVPVFGHSDNHAGLQICDIFSSSLLFPICAHYFFGKKIKNSHLHPAYEKIAQRYCHRIQTMQFRYGPSHRRQGGLVVSDPFGKRGAGQLFSSYPAAARSGSTSES